MMKVTFLIGEYPPMQGGIADHTAYLAQHLTPLNVDSSILISRRWQETEPPESAENILEQTSGTLAVVHPLVPNWGWRCWSAVAGYLKAHRPDFLHIQYQAAAFDLGGWVNWLPWYLKKRRVPTPVVTTFHDLRIPYIFPKAGSFRWKSVLALARYSDGVICTNRADLHTLQNSLTSPPPLKLVPLGSNVDSQPPADFERTAWRSRYQAGEQTLLLAYFGFLNESKGGEELIEALALLRQQGLDARLLFIGGDVGHADPTNVAYAQRVQALIERFSLSEFVYRTGYVDLRQVSANLLAADAVVMPYRDGVSFRRTTLIAALRHGCPVVSTAPADPALIPEILPGQNMLLAPPQDAVNLALAIAPLAADLNLRRQLAAGARQLGGLFEWSRIAAETAELYRLVISGT
jgi:glycosyltransferase involved in cell wall biosynthesis